MGFLDFLKKKNTVAEQKPQSEKLETNSFGERLDRLTPDGELPWGWIARNKDFTEKITDEYTYFLNMWLDSRSGSPMEQYSSLKSFVLYLEDAERLCKSKGECFEWWFYNILASKEYIEKRKGELNDLTKSFDELQSNYDQRENELIDLDDRIIQTLIDHPNILQSDFVKLFDPVVQSDVREKLYFLDKSGKLQRTKSGRSYLLHYKG